MHLNLKERLSQGERIAIEPEHLETVLEAIPSVSLHWKLKYLESRGVVKSMPSKRKGRPSGGEKYHFEGRPLKIIGSYKGPFIWNNEGISDFNEPHNLAIDSKTNTVIAMAKAD